MAVKQYTLSGTAGNDAKVIYEPDTKNQWKYTWDGLAGTDSLSFDRLPKSEFTIYQNATGIHVDSVSTASHMIYVTLNNVEKLKFSNGATIVDLTKLFDTTAPLVASMSPADEGVDVALSSDLIFTFNEAVQRGTGIITLRTAAGTVIETFDAASSAQLSIAGSVLTVNPTANLSGNATYYLELAAGTITDAAGNAYAGTQVYNFTTATSNHLPTGGVTLSGIPKPGQTLTAANTLTDADGLGAIAYKWQADGVDIAGATAASYTLTPSDAGKHITAVASYTDALGTAERVSSAAIQVNTPPVARDNHYTVAEDLTLVLGNLISDGWAPGTPGQTLFRDTDADGDALSIHAVSVGGVTTAWTDLPSSTLAADLLSVAQGGPVWKTVALANGTAWLQEDGTLRYVSQTNSNLGDSLGYSIKDVLGNTASAQAHIEVLPVDDAATGQMVISGDRRLGGTLSLTINGLNDADGTPTTTIQWQWLNAGQWINLDAAQANSWSVPSDPGWVGRLVRAKVLATDPLGGTTELISDSRTILDANASLSSLTLTTSHWKTGKGVLAHVDIGITQDGTSLITGTDGRISVQGVADPDSINDGRTLLHPHLGLAGTEASITLTDVLGALKVYLNKPLDAAYDTPYKYIAADFQGDGDVDLSDVLSLLKYYLKKPVDAAPGWVFVDSAQTVVSAGESLPESNTAGLALSKIHAVPADIEVDLNNGMPLQLIGVLRGDLDGN